MDNPKNVIEVLLIEDNPIDILIIQEMLAEAEGISFNVESVSLLKDGLERLTQRRFDVILADLGLPDSHETDTFEMVYSQGHDIPIIVLTAHDDEEFAVKAIQSGAQDYLIKGEITFNLLIRSIRYAIERNRSEKAIRESKEEWERTFNAIDDIITILDPDMRIVRTNRALMRMLDTGPENLIGKYCYEIFRDRTEPCPECPAWDIIRKNESLTEDLEYVYMSKIFQITLSPLFDENYAFIGFVHLAKDISEKKKMEVQLRQTQRIEAIATLAGGIAHDLNNILFPIYGYTEMTLKLMDENKVVRRNLGRVLEAAERARVMVQQILTFSRRGDGEKEHTPWKIQPIVKEALKLLRGSLPSTIDIRRNIDERCGPVLAEPTQIHQIVMNLCTNAYHAMREKGGILEVSLNEVVLGSDDAAFYPDMAPGPHLKLGVSDTGHGMDKSVTEKIFDPYFTTKEKEEGTGLGLAVVHGIVKNHGGHITVYSELGRGTAFHVYLPLIADIENLRPKVEKTTGLLPEGRGEHILLVDDEEAIAEMLKQRLEILGYQVTPRTSSSEAVEVFREGPENFDIVITDMTMPQMTGVELSAEVRRIRPDIPIILCSGFSELITEERAKAMGIQGYIMKPVAIKEMAEAIRGALDAP
ncbi:response regulator [Desulfobacterales bacterium HSG2]|nr:response regulator [Desulfobacterales bacterium HSG2]